jgi:hypothetical protein
VDVGVRILGEAVKAVTAHHTPDIEVSTDSE